MKKTNLRPAGFAVAETATALRRTPQTDLKFIGAGELEAINLGFGKRPRWLITQQTLDSFLASRSKRTGEPTDG